jgi:hypothetical protein
MAYRMWSPGSALMLQRSKAGAGGVEDCIGVDARGAVEIGDVAGLAKAVDAERDDRVAGNRTEPGLKLSRKRTRRAETAFCFVVCGNLLRGAISTFISLGY